MAEEMAIDISSPGFSATELAVVAGANRKLIDPWLERDLLEPTHVRRTGGRKSPRFSVIAVFKARVIRELLETVWIGASPAVDFGVKAEEVSAKKAEAASHLVAELATHDALADLSTVIADEGWMWAVARSVERGKLLPIMAAITRSTDCWDLFLEFDVGKFADRIEADRPYVVIPIGAIFASVYSKCKAIVEARTPEQPRPRHRGKA